MTEEESRVYQKIIQRQQELIEQDKLIQSLEEKLAGGTATYQDAWDYANRVGRATSTAMTEQIDALISDGIDGYETIMEALYEGYDTSAVYAATVQTIQNKKSGLGIKGQQADFDRDRASGIAHLGSNAEDATSATRYLGAPVEHFTENVVGDTIKANEAFQYQSGLNPKIKRTSTGKCCRWCDEIAGVYDYPAPDEVYRRHQNCNCLVEYYPGNGLKQNAHTKRWNPDAEPAAIEQRKSVLAARFDGTRTIWEDVDLSCVKQMQHGFSAFPPDDVLNQYCQRIVPQKGYFDVAMHGDWNGVAFSKKEKANMIARDLAMIIRRNPDYNGEEKIRLLSCFTGKTPDDGDYCFAEYLANALGVDVLAPNKKLYINPDGSYYVGRHDEGTMIPFKPNQRRRLK